MKVGRAIADEPVTTAYPALLVSLGSGVSIIKVGGVQTCRRESFPPQVLVLQQYLVRGGRFSRVESTVSPTDG